MPEVVYYVAVSVDGYIATSDGGVECLDPFQGGSDDHGFAELYASVDGLLMGSRTYEFSLSHPPWRSPDKPSWVFTRRELPVAHPSVTLTSDDPAQLVRSLQGSKRLWLLGGGRLAASFRREGLITQCIISVVPVILGGGIPLFADAPGQASLSLLDAKTHSSGIVQLSYEMKPGGAKILKFSGGT